MAWVILIASGVLEAVWATALGDSGNFKNKKPTALFLITLPISLVGLSYAMTDIPTGTAYTVWIGIGAVLTVLISIARGKEQMNLARAIILPALVGCVIGLQVVS